MGNWCPWCVGAATALIAANRLNAGQSSNANIQTADALTIMRPADRWQGASDAPTLEGQVSAAMQRNPNIQIRRTATGTAKHQSLPSSTRRANDKETLHG